MNYDYNALTGAALDKLFEEVILSPELGLAHDFFDHDASAMDQSGPDPSPSLPLLHSTPFHSAFSISPETPALQTALLSDLSPDADFLTSPAIYDIDEGFGDMPLFDCDPTVFGKPQTLEKFGAAGSVSATSLFSTLPTPPVAVASPSNTPRTVPTGHRRNITAAELVPLDAPTQPRNYLTPSTTSRKELPSAFLARTSRKRGASVVDDEQDLVVAIETKRRQNTIAARRSRQRKLEHTRQLEQINEQLQADLDAWRERALAAEAALEVERKRRRLT